MTKITVTGGSGFIGTNLIAFYDKCGYEIQNLDVKPSPDIAHMKYWDEADILDLEQTQTKIARFDPHYIVHLAAVTDLNRTDLQYYDANIQGVANLISICEQLTSLKKVIFTSSMYVCKPGYIPGDDDDYKFHTRYGESKVQGELLVKAIKNPTYEWTLVRPTSIWGPWFKKPYIDFFKVVYQGRYFDFGRACTKTYGFVENTVYQIDALLKSNKTHEKVYYLGDLPATQISEWANEISMELGKRKVKSLPYGMLKMAAMVGDVIAKMGISFPITSFRLSNMTTNNILPLENLYELAPDPPVTRVQGVRKTLQWLGLDSDENRIRGNLS